MFTPKWKKDAQLLLKAGRKFLHYKRDLLKEDRILEVESRLQDLKECLKRKDKDGVKEASKQLDATCEKSLPRSHRQNALQENIEVLFVAIVIALGIRTYYLQPFRIPTGSMQPSLNGIQVHHAGADDKNPNLIKKGADFVLRGRTYLNKKAHRDLEVVKIKDSSFFLFVRSTVFFNDGSKVKLPIPTNEYRPNGAAEHLSIGQSLQKGEPIFRGWIDTGDLVLVDKISYHFRRPQRGETFVFNTLGLDTQRTKNLPREYIRARFRGQEKGSHFIKRLCALPGDEVTISRPYLFINGEKATEPGIVKVAEAQGIYGEEGRRGYYNQIQPNKAKPWGRYTIPPQKFFLHTEKPTATLSAEGKHFREYLALGDNSVNSSDSRFWGPVKEYNLVGPAFFSLWPITTGHWGFID